MDEFSIIRKMTSHLPSLPSDVMVGFGDDAAVVNPKHLPLVMSTDTMVEGTHFLRSTITFHNLGYKSLAVSLSDVAAMGGTPLYALVSLTVNDDVSVTELEDVYRGFSEATERFGCHVIGGDIVHTDGPTVVTTTVFGECARPILRSGAKAGDILFVTGKLGGSSAGFEAQQGMSHISPSSEVALAMCHQHPEPRIWVGQSCAEVGVHSLNDISDGLASELNEIAQASDVRCVVDESSIPVWPEVVEWAKSLQKNPIDYALYGGEDYELVGSASRQSYAKLLTSANMLRVPIATIGEVTSGDGVVLRTRNGRLEVLEAKGYNHFRR